MLQKRLDKLITTTTGQVIENHCGPCVKVIIMNHVTWELLKAEMDKHQSELERLSITSSPRSYRKIDVYISGDVESNEFKLY